MNGKTGYRALLCALLLAAASLAQATTYFNLFGPSTGILVGNANSPATTAAAWANIQALLTGTCDSSHVVNGAGGCVTPAAGTVTSVGLSMPSGFSVGGSPVTGSGTLAVTTALNGVLKGNGSGFTTAAVSDILGLFSGTCSSTTFLRGDGTCNTPAGVAGGSSGQVNYNSSGTLAGAANLVYNSTSEQVSVAGNATGINFVVNGTANFFAEQIVGNSTTGGSAGLLIQAGTNGSDTAFKILNEAGTSTFLQVIGNGGMELGAPTGGDEGLGTLNATGLYVNGVTAATAQNGSFTGTLTGMTATVTGTFNYVVSGDTVTLYSSSGILGTSNSTAMTITGLPNAINPVNAQLFVTWGVENSGTANNLAVAEINTNNTVTLGLSSSGASSTPVTFGVNDFTSSGTKGINGGWTITYSLD